MITKQELIAFEKECEAAFNAGRIRAPLHLSAGNEDQLIEIFQRVKPTDYVFSTWRSHFHALLHGVPREQLMAKVLAGESISINVPERRFYSSAICGGCLPIALGVAWAEKRRPSGLRCFDCKQVVTHFIDQDRYGGCPNCLCFRTEPSLCHVWCFVGDMAAEMGAFAEASRYAAHHELPLTIVVEDNGKCVNADTKELWGGSHNVWVEISWQDNSPMFRRTTDPITVERYRYQLAWPHMGTGIRVEFPDQQPFAPTGGM